MDIAPLIVLQKVPLLNLTPCAFPQQSRHAQQIAAAAGTIPYDVLCGIGRRVERVYL